MGRVRRQDKTESVEQDLLPPCVPHNRPIRTHPSGLKPLANLAIAAVRAPAASGRGLRGKRARVQGCGREHRRSGARSRKEGKTRAKGRKPGNKHGAATRGEAPRGRCRYFCSGAGGSDHPAGGHRGHHTHRRDLVHRLLDRDRRHRDDRERGVQRRLDLRHYRLHHLRRSSRQRYERSPQRLRHYHRHDHTGWRCSQHRCPRQHNHHRRRAGLRQRRHHEHGCGRPSTRDRGSGRSDRGPSVHPERRYHDCRHYSELPAFRADQR